MFRAAIGFFLLALVAYFFGAYQIGGLSMDFGKILLFTFLVLAIVSAIAGSFRGRGTKPLL